MYSEVPPVIVNANQAFPFARNSDRSNAIFLFFRPVELHCRERGRSWRSPLAQDHPPKETAGYFRKPSNYDDLLKLGPLLKLLIDEAGRSHSDWP